MVRTRKPASYDQILALPEQFVGEIIDDELYVSPRPALRHAFATGHHADDEKVRAEPFSEVELDLQAWWPTDAPSANVPPPALADRNVKRPGRPGRSKPSAPPARPKPRKR